MSSMSTGLSDDERKSGTGRRRRGLAARWDDRDAFTVDEAGEILGLSRASAFAAANRGDIPTIRIGKRLIVPRAALVKLLGADEVNVPAPGLQAAQIAAAPGANVPQRVEVAIEVSAPRRGSGRRKPAPSATPVGVASR